MSFIGDWKSEPTVVYGRTTSTRSWTLIYQGLAGEAQTAGDRWRETVFDYGSQIVGETLTMPISPGETVAVRLPRNF